MAGKLLVWTLLFLALGLVLVLVLYHWMHYPLAGSIWNMFLAIVLLVVSSEAVAIFILGLFPVPRLALSLGALYSVLSFSLAGFTLPVEVMPPFIQGFAAVFPLRHYYLFFVQESLFGSGMAGWWQEAAHLLLFLVLPLAVLYRLKRAYIFQNYPKD